MIDSAPKASEQQLDEQKQRATDDAIEVMQEIGKTLQRMCISRVAQGKPELELYAAALGTAMALGFQIGFGLPGNDKAELFYEAVARLGKRGIARGQDEAAKLAKPQGSA